jgi:hypothetical protein
MYDLRYKIWERRANAKMLGFGRKSQLENPKIAN